MADAFNYVKKGYDPIAVDQYIAQLEDVLKSYKDKDASIKNAILNAQIAADNIVKNAELKAEHITRSAVKQLNYIMDSVERQRQFITQFEYDYEEIIKKYLREFNGLKVSTLHEDLDNLKEYLASLNAHEEESPEEQ